MTWDVDSRDRAMCGRVRRFVFGNAVSKGGRIYRYQGFVEREGVRYIGQSVLFVIPVRLSELEGFLHQRGVAHVVTHASIGTIRTC